MNSVFVSGRLPIRKAQADACASAKEGMLASMKEDACECEGGMLASVKRDDCQYEGGRLRQCEGG